MLIRVESFDGDSALVLELPDDCPIIVKSQYGMSIRFFDSENKRLDFTIKPVIEATQAFPK